MEIDINCIRGKSPDGGTDGLRQKTQAVALVEGMVRSCKAVSNYETACTILLEILPIVSSDPAAMDVFLRGKEEIRQFFENKNTPQPSTKYEGCNFFNGDNTGAKVVGNDIGQMYMDNHGHVINNKNKEPQE